MKPCKKFLVTNEEREMRLGYYYLVHLSQFI